LGIESEFRGEDLWISTVRRTEAKLNTILYAMVGTRTLGYANRWMGLRQSRTVKGLRSILPEWRYLRRNADLVVETTESWFISKCIHFLQRGGSKP
jgi:hypothetical protein